MLKKFIAVLIIVIISAPGVDLAETKDKCTQTVKTEISTETLMNKFGVKIEKGRVTGLPGTGSLKDCEIEIDGKAYRTDFEFSYLDVYKVGIKKDEDIMTHIKEYSGEKHVLMIQASSIPTDTEAFVLLRSLGIIADYVEYDNPDLPGGFRLDGKVSRAEFIRYVVKLLGYNDAANEAQGNSKFSDIENNWAKGYINVGSSLGIMNGYEDGTFKPNECITYQEALAVIVRMLGYEPKVKLKGKYPEGYLTVAKELGVTDNVKIEATSKATLGITAHLLLNSMYVPQMKQIGHKPVIYLYPASEQKVSVELSLKGRFTYTYPQYNNGWNVTAKPDGTIINSEDGMEYSYLFWEGEFQMPGLKFDKGFVVEGRNTTKFLQEKLALMGLTQRERNEFIVYWAPKMQNNRYNLITFAGREYEDAAALAVFPSPDSVLRIFMVYKPLDEPVEVEPQELNSFERKGFTVVEWGGTEVN